MKFGGWKGMAVGTVLVTLGSAGPAMADFEIREERVDQTVPAHDGGAWLAKHEYVLFGTQNIARACLGHLPAGGAKVYYQCFGQGVPSSPTQGETFNHAQIRHLAAVNGGVLVTATIGWQSTNGACNCRTWLFRVDNDGSMRWSQSLHPAGSGYLQPTALAHRMDDGYAYLGAVIAEPSPTPWDLRSVRARSVVSRIDVLNGQLVDSLRLERKEVWWPASPSFPEFSSEAMFQIHALSVDAQGDVIAAGSNYFHLTDPWMGYFDPNGVSAYGFVVRFNHGQRSLRQAWRARYEPVGGPYRRDLSVGSLAPAADGTLATMLVSTEAGDRLGPQLDLAMVNGGGNLAWRRTLQRESSQDRQVHAIVRTADGGVVASITRTNRVGYGGPYVSTGASIESLDASGNLRARIESTLPQDAYTINRTFHSGLNLSHDGSGDLIIGSAWMGAGRLAHDEVRARSTTLKHFSCSWTRPAQGWPELGPAQWGTPVFRNFQPGLIKGDWILAAPVQVPLQHHIRLSSQRSCP